MSEISFFDVKQQTTQDADHQHGPWICVLEKRLPFGLAQT